MAINIKKTAFRVRRPLAILSAFAAGCMFTSYLPGQDSHIEKSTVQLDKLFTSDEKIEFSPVPALNLVPSPGLQKSAPPVFNPPVYEGPSAKEFFGALNLQPSAVETRAKMVVPATPERASKGPVRTASRIPSAANAFKPSMSVPGFGAPSKKSTYSNEHILSQQPKPSTDLNTASLASYNQVSQRFEQPIVAPMNATVQPQMTQRSGNFNRMPLSNPQVQQSPRVATLPNLGFNNNGNRYSGVHKLRSVDMNQFETRVVEIWGSRLQTATSADGRYVRVELPTLVRDRMTMMVDRRAEQVTFEGGESLKDNWHNLVEKIDSPAMQQIGGRVVQTVLVDGGHAQESTIRQVAFLMGLNQDQDTLQLPAGSLPAGGLPGLTNQDEIPAGTQGIKNNVKIIQDPETGVFQLIGEPEDIAIIRDVIMKITAETTGAQQLVERLPLTNMQSEAVAEQIQTMYDGSSFAANNGPVQVQALASPNSLIVIGQRDAIDAVRGIVSQMDVAASDGQSDGFKSFKLKYLSAADAAQRLNLFFGQQAGGNGGLPVAPVVVIPDFRSNTVVVKGSAQFILQAEQLLNTIDVIDSPAVNEVKVIQLRNTTATDMQVVIQDAINGQLPNAGLGQGSTGQNGAGGQNQAQAAQANVNGSSLRSPVLTLQSVGEGGGVTRGIMFDVRVTADANSNSLVVTGPRESLPLVEALVKQLDRLPDAETQIKVFEIVNGSAEELFNMLDALFGADQQGQQQQGTNLSQLPLQGASVSDGQTLVNLRFSFDNRSNTIIASGAAGDLQVVEDLLNRLDAQADNEMPAQVYRLSNAPATDVADAINSWLTGVSDLVGDDTRQNNPVSLANRTVIVVAEIVSNSLIVSARPENLAEIEEIIRALDRRPPMVKVKVLIAEVDLNALEEFGVELGVQDSLVFDRGTTLTAGGGISGIGFPFNNGQVANSNAIAPNNVAGQVLSNLGVGKINSDLGYGGLVLSAGNESINILMRALKDRSCVRTLSRPQIMTLENLQGRVSIGAEVPRVSSATPNGLTVTQNVEFIDVGVILEVTPRVSPDGMIVMAVNAKKSAVGPDSTGITIGFGSNGEPIRSPQIIETEANTTLMARSGQTVVFSGLIQEEKVHAERGTPILSDLPFIGPLFKFETDQTRRTELLIVMTPYLITDDEELANQNYSEFDRMHWCESDVAELYGSTDYQGHGGTTAAVETIYPDMDPMGAQPMMPQQVQDLIEAPQPAFESLAPQSQAIPKQDKEVRKASFRTGLRRRR